MSWHWFPEKTEVLKHSRHLVAKQRAIDHHQDGQLLQCWDAFFGKVFSCMEVVCPKKTEPSLHDGSSV